MVVLIMLELFGKYILILKGRLNLFSIVAVFAKVKTNLVILPEKEVHKQHHTVYSLYDKE